MKKLKERREAFIDWLIETFGDPDAFWSLADDLIPVIMENYKEWEDAIYSWGWLPNDYKEWGYKEMKDFLYSLPPNKAWHLVDCLKEEEENLSGGEEV